MSFQRREARTVMNFLDDSQTNRFTWESEE